MEICPFLSNSIWEKKENGEEILILKEVPCQKEKCFLFRDGRCGVAFDFNYTVLKENINEFTFNLNENMKALYDLIKETREEGIKRVSSIEEKFNTMQVSLAKILYKFSEDIVNYIKSSKEEESKRLEEFKAYFQEILNNNYENFKKILEEFVKERNEFMKYFESALTKILDSEKQKFEEITKLSESKISELMSNLDREREVLNELFLKMKEFTEGLVSYKEKMEEVVKREENLRKFETAKSFYLRGEYKEAEKILKEVLKSYELEEGYLLLGLTLIGNKNFEEAEIYLKKYMETHPEVPEVLSGIARILFERGEYESAISLLEKAKEKSPDSEDILYLYGLALIRKGEIDEAKKVFERIIEINPYFEPAREAIKKYINPLS
ncbi:MAG: tetratricopeptide repeat protein [candidate division WOR-3 bacterium]